MHPFLQQMLAVVAGLVVGSVVNMATLMAGTNLIPPPPGVDLSSAEGLAAAMPVMEPIHFLAPFLAHALGTLSGAWLAARLSKFAPSRAAWTIGGAFLAGGAYMVLKVPSPLWFSIADLVLAYLPMAWLGLYFSGKNNAA